jgi:hypothetical protein
MSRSTSVIGCNFFPTFQPSANLTSLRNSSVTVGAQGVAIGERNGTETGVSIQFHNGTRRAHDRRPPQWSSVQRSKKQCPFAAILFRSRFAERSYGRPGAGLF